MRNGSLTSTWLRRATILMVLFGMSWQSVSAACPPRFQGINLVPLPTGWYNSAVEMKFPTAEHIAYYKNAGMNAIRLPIQWEEMQPTLFGALNPRYVEHARDFLDLVQAQGMKVLVDLHNYGRYREQLIGAPQVPAAAFKDVWTKLASAFGSHPAIYAWGLMNEPHHTNGLWHKVAQAGVDGIRAVDSGRLIYVGGDGWSSTANWPSENPEPFVTDPSNRVFYEAHIYFDDDFSGKYQVPLAPTMRDADLAERARQRLQPFIGWLAAKRQRGVIGEFGVPMDDPRYLAALNTFLDMTDAACLSWFAWAGGAWRPNYELSHEPINGKDRPQMKMLRERL